jgi:hypothetical protein
MNNFSALIYVTFMLWRFSYDIALFFIQCHHNTNTSQRIGDYVAVYIDVFHAIAFGAICDMAYSAAAAKITLKYTIN